MNTINKLISTIFILCLTTFVFAQNVVTGTLKDKDTGEPLVGANVFMVNANNRTLSGTIANANGEFKMVIREEKDLSIVFSFIGYKSQKIKYEGQKNINITLESDSRILEDAVVTAKAIKQNQLGLTDREIVTSTQKLDAEMIKNVPVTSIEDALQGRLANVDIVSGSEPGSSSTIRIRGTSSLNASSEPLIVVDGVPYPTDISSDFNFSTANDEDFGALVNISPNDIETIEVLKDAAATAVWGSKGANGVLLINTKKGISGKTKFTFSSKFDVRKEPNTIPMLNSGQYIALIQDAAWNSLNDVGYNSSSSSTYLEILYDTDELNYDPSYVYYDEYNQETDWLGEITQLGFSSDNSFSMTGGGDRANYRLSVGYLTEDGTTIGTSFARLSTMLSVKYKFSKKFDITTDFSFANGVRESYWSNPRGHALIKMPNMSPYYIDSDGNRTDEYFTPYEYFQGTVGTIKSTKIKSGVFNPVAMVNESINETNSTQSRFVFNLHYELLKGLDFYSTTGLDLRSTRNKRFLPQCVIGVPWTDEWFNRSADLISDNVYITTDNKFIYKKEFNENHQIISSLIIQTSDKTSASYQSEVSGNASSSSSDPTAGGVIANIGSGTSQARSVGFNGNIHYTLLGKYMFNAGYRYEANSTMGANNRWASFPSLGVAWLVDQEKFMKNLPWVSSLKLRYSWGQSGNSPDGSYCYVGTFNPITPGYINMTAVEPYSIQLDNLKWETVTQNNFGVDMGIMNDKLRFTVDIYDKLTTDMLQEDVTLPTTSGFDEASWYNSGSMMNKGWEFRVDYDVLKNKTWDLSVNFNIARNRNEILELPDNLTDYKYDFGNGEYAYKVIEGNPLGSFYGYKYLGVYQNAEETYARDTEGNLIHDIGSNPVYMVNGTIRAYPGDAKYKDVNGDGVINQYDIVYLGNSNPLFTGGGGFNLRYKNISFMTFFHGRSGQKVVNQTRIDTENMRGSSNQSIAVLKRWRREGDDTDIPRALYGRGYNYLGSDRFVEDASFLRLKTVTVKYSFPKEFVKRFKMDRFEVYMTAYDIFTWTKYTGQDPEVSLSTDDGSAYLIAKDDSSTPKSKRLAIGLSIGF